ncbi:hypothetical protein D3C87_1604630 [compost metagenome]
MISRLLVVALKLTLMPSLAALDFSWSARPAVSVTPTMLTAVPEPTLMVKFAVPGSAPVIAAVLTVNLASVLAVADRPPMAPFI